MPALAFPASEIRINPPADPEADATPLIVDAVERAIASGVKRLVLASGTYQIHPIRAWETFVWVSNHDPGLRRTAFPIRAAKDLEIDGNGARLVMHERAMIPFMVYNSENVTIRNFSIDWDHLLYAQATVVAVDEDDDSFEAEFLPECNARVADGQLVHGPGSGADRVAALWQLRPGDGWRQNLQWTHWIDPVTRRPLPAAQQLPLQAFSPWNDRLDRPAEVEQIGPHRFRLRHAFTPLPAAGTAFAAKGMLMPNRASPAIHIAQDSRGITVENVVVHQASGMGVIAESSTDITLRGFHVRLPAGSPRLVTTTADGTHFNQCKGLIVIEDCTFENMLDDAINVHGVYAIVDGILADDRVGMRLGHFQQLGLDFVRPGERVRFCRQETLLPYLERTVKTVRRINESYFELTFTEPVKEDLQPGSVMDNADRQPDFLFRRNTVRNIRGRPVVVKTGGRVIIEDNLFDRAGGGGMGVTIFTGGDAHSWYESGAVSDVTIRRNTFVPLNQAPVIRIAPVRAGVTDVLPPYHRNVRIEDNEFRVAGPALVEANRVAGLRFAGNTVVAADPRAAAPSGPSFILHASEDVTIERNRIDLPDIATIEQTSPTARLVVRDNAGLEEEPRGGISVPRERREAQQRNRERPDE